MRTELSANGKHWTMTLDSLAELAEVAQRHYGACETTKIIGARSEGFLGVKDPAEALALAATGWEAQLPDALRAANDAVARLRDDQVIQAFVPTFDVAGCDVDMARFLSDEPECMVDYPLTEIVKAGRVITLCSSSSVSAAVSAESIIRRGQTVVALALALEALGYAVEIWTDNSSAATSWNGGTRTSPPVLTVRTMVKGARDVLDPARIMFALAHPAYQRCLGFASMHEAPANIRRAAGVPGGYGLPVAGLKTLPEGTIYLPAVRSDHDIPDLDVALMAYLRDLEIVTE